MASKTHKRQPRHFDRKSMGDAPQRKCDASRHAARLIYRVCCLAGSTTLIANLREAESDLPAIVKSRDTPALFNWLVSALSYQGISDAAAYEYMRRHGRVSWELLRKGLIEQPSCPKPQSYWTFSGCRYDKTSHTCAEPDHIGVCPLPVHTLRNGRLNQTAYSLYLFVRDIAQDDFVQWIDDRLTDADNADPKSRLATMREALLGPLRNVFGVSDKILTMTLSAVLVSAPTTWPRWAEVGVSMIAIDTLVHNFMVRTGILRRFGAEHSYGLGCYEPGGCAEIIEIAAAGIDARRFNPEYPSKFARFVQHAIWNYCAQQGLDICNGNQINDLQSCSNIQCGAYTICDRITLLK